MAKCFICKTSCIDECHPACGQERAHRILNGKCARCGKEDALKGSARCGGCDNNSTYKNYPGGSA